MAKLLSGGEIIELTSDLGGGKTTFVQGLAQGLGYEGEVPSPTFTVSREYRLPGGLELHHYDLYRLRRAGVVGQVLGEDLGDPAVITVLEWGGIMAAELPTDRLVIKLEVTGEADRQITFTAGGVTSGKLIEGLKS